MPDHPRPRNRDFSRFDSMTDGELEAILRSDAQNFEGEESDTEMLLYVMEVLAERNKTTASTNQSAKEAFETFKQYYMPETDTDDQLAHTSNPAKRKTVVSVVPLWLRRMTAAVAVVVLIILGATTVNALGYDLWEIVVQWTQETFHFGIVNSGEAMAPATGDEREFTSLQEVLDLEKITTPLVPTWIPARYKLETVKIEETPMQKTYLAIYLCEEDMLRIQVKRFLGEDPQQIEQSDDIIEIYEYSGIKYYILRNYDQLKVIWVIDCFECYISGQLSVDELKSMINSVMKE